MTPASRPCALATDSRDERLSYVSRWCSQISDLLGAVPDLRTPAGELPVAQVRRRRCYACWVQREPGLREQRTSAAEPSAAGFARSQAFHSTHPKPASRAPQDSSMVENLEKFVYPALKAARALVSEDLKNAFAVPPPPPSAPPPAAPPPERPPLAPPPRRPPRRRRRHRRRRRTSGNAAAAAAAVANGARAVGATPSRHPRRRPRRRRRWRRRCSTLGLGRMRRLWSVWVARSFSVWASSPCCGCGSSSTCAATDDSLAVTTASSSAD